MAATSLVVRQPPPAAGPMKRRGGRSNKGRIGTRQIGLGVAGALTSAAVSAGLCSFLGMRPQWAGAATGGLGAVGAALASGSSLRPFAAGAALGGGTLAVTSLLVDFETKRTKPPARADASLQLDGRAPDVVMGPPPAAKDANAPGAGVGNNYRRAASVTDEMRAQIARAMQDTRFRRG